jgi:preprotein translocase subunit SecG
METALYILHVLVCLAMLPVILLQSGKGGGVSSVFGGGSRAVLGNRGASTFLTHITTVSAIVFMCTSMSLSWISSRSKSVIGAQESPAQEQSAAGAEKAPGAMLPAKAATPTVSVPAEQQ